jgi:hypothetical protein
VQFKLAQWVDDGVAGVVTSLEADDHVRRFAQSSGRRGQVIYHLVFAFIAPLGADDGDNGHGIESSG